jgi:hypothetical protein
MIAGEGVVETLERKILPHLEAAATNLGKRYPRLTINTWSSPTGSLTEYQGHDIGIDCVDPAALDAEPCNVFLTIGVMHLTTQPLLCDAKVAWDSEGPASGLDLLLEPVLWSEEVLQNIEDRLPDLIQSLADELERLNKMGKNR